MEAALAFFIGFGRVEVIPFVGQVVLFEVRLHSGVGQVKHGTDFQGPEIRVVRHDVEFSAAGVLHLAQRGDPDFGRQFLHASLEWFEFHDRAELLETGFVFRRGHGAVDGFIVGDAKPGQVGF